MNKLNGERSEFTARAVNGKPLLSNSSGSIIPSCLANVRSLSSMIGNGNSPVVGTNRQTSPVHSTFEPR